MADARRTIPPTSRFVSTVEVLSGAPPEKFRWDGTSVDSGGWSGCVVLSPNTTYAAFQQVRPPTKWNNEVHVLWPGSWRDTQVAGLLDDGSVYSTYGHKAHAKHKVPWRDAGSTVAVRLEVDTKNQVAKVTFEVGQTVVYSAEVKGDATHKVETLLIEARAHPNGSLKLI